MPAWCQRPTSAGNLFDHLICTSDHRWWHRKTESFRRFQVDQELEFRWLLNWKIGGFCPLQNFVDIDCRALMKSRFIDEVCHQTVSIKNMGREVINRWQSMPRRQTRNPDTLDAEYAGARHKQPICSFSYAAFNRNLNVRCGFDVA